MYIDKKLKTDVQCVQTLSRLNRTSKGKEDTFVLDFINDPEDTQKSFQKYYKKAKLIGEVDFNKLYDKLQEIQNHNIFSTDDVEKFSSEFFRRNRQSDQAFQQYIDTAVDNFNQKSSDEIKKDIRSLINSFLKMYEFLSQIITFQEPKFEKHFRYLKFVAACLPRDAKEFIDIRSLLELEFLKIEHQSQESLSLDDEDSNMEPENFESAPPPETLGEMISEIISRLNDQWSSNFDEEDIVTLENISNNLQESEEIEDIHEGNNSQESKERFFNDKFKQEILNIMPTDTGLYNKIMDNPELYTYIQDRLYEIYNQRRSA
jgi:type I restriction enzyme R subunit